MIVDLGGVLFALIPPVLVSRGRIANKRGPVGRKTVPRSRKETVDQRRNRENTVMCPDKWDLAKWGALSHFVWQNLDK